MLATAVIFARESLEASLIVAIIFSYLKKSFAQKPLYRQVWLGIGTALVLDFILGFGIWITIHAYSGTVLQTELEGTTYFLAAVLLTGMSFWMKRESRYLKHHLQEAVEKSLHRNGWALSVLAGITVGREGLETAIFVLALSFHTTPFSMLAGALIGMTMGVYLSYGIYRLGSVIPLKTFFEVFGTLLLIFAAALIADGIEDFQQVRWLPGAHWVLWHTALLLPESSVLGDILHTFLGYAQSPTALQMLAYAGFLAITVPLYLKGRTPAPSKTAQE
ncbi:MAG: FTR1 family protein [Firmicutes bacterium]|uniref:Iron permease n=1 Tax=Sulfobacillus benefaciens TaxID=453960 RepID=A0A2T2X9G5_9FIRM|nr:FTR1 family protein [Bacillota bacterium]MCL5013131.1 FTR1 family protein [Bacillota bacterium]PSR31130.1 MAG: hypothetical protein C7B43_03255 [Sulfobacillus benefaciens]HBQ95258.1 hypothetical protein [Sulfobacillus sp.]